MEVSFQITVTLGGGNIFQVSVQCAQNLGWKAHEVFPYEYFLAANCAHLLFAVLDPGRDFGICQSQNSRIFLHCLRRYETEMDGP